MTKVAILVLNDYSNDSRVLKTASSLAKKYHVEVFAFNNGKQPRKEVDSLGVVANRDVKYTKKLSGIAKKLDQMLSFICYFVKTAWRLRAFNIVHCNDLETLPVGVVGKLFNRKLKVVYDAHEYQTETLWMQSTVKKKITKIFEKLLLGAVDEFCVVSPSIAKEYKRLYDVDNVNVILNAPHLESINKNQYFRKHFKLSAEQKIFLYQGGLTEGRGIQLMLDAFAELEHQEHVLIVMGYGQLEGLVKRYTRECANIFYHPAVPPKELLQYTASADFGITLIEDLCLNYKYCLPNKLFEYMMAGLPVICSNLPEMRRVVESSLVGIVLSEHTVKALCDGVMRISQFEPAVYDGSIKKARLHYNWEQQEVVLYDMYDNLTQVNGERA